MIVDTGTELEPSKLFYVDQEDEKLEKLPISSNKKRSGFQGDIHHLHDDETDEHSVTVSGDYKGDPNSFEVGDPQMGSHVTYTVKGYDTEGPFEGKRRYNDFFNLRSILVSRMPGIFIPPIPPKMIMNKNNKFLEERAYFLQRFLQLTCRIKHIVSSDEFILFSRPSGDFDKMINTLPKEDAKFLLNRVRNEFKFEEEDNPSEAQENMEAIQNYENYIKRIAPLLKNMKDRVKPLIAQRDAQNSAFPDLIYLLSKLVNKILDEYADSVDEEKDSKEIKDSIFTETANDISEKLMNPFRDYYLWLKGEILDLQALTDCFESTERLKKIVEKLESK